MMKCSCEMHASKFVVSLFGIRKAKYMVTFEGCLLLEHFSMYKHFTSEELICMFSTRPISLLDKYVKGGSTVIGHTI